jgi:hypothetical protein
MISDSSSIKHEARRMVESLPADADGDEVLYEAYVRQSTESGLKDCRAGRTVPVSQVRRRLGLAS